LNGGVALKRSYGLKTRFRDTLSADLEEISVSGFKGLAMALLTKRLSTHRQLIRFATVGLLGAVVDYAVYLTLTRAVSLGYLEARAMSVMCAILNNFLLNKWWTFNRGNSKRGGSEYLRFLVVSLLSLGVNLSIMLLLIDYLKLKLLLGSYADIAAMSVAILVAFIINYQLNKRWTFGR
jgi:putative flippase GtrA